MRRLLRAELAPIAFGRASKTATMKSGRSFLVNDSVPRCFLVGLVAADVVDSTFRFRPLLREVVVFEVVAGCGLPCVDSWHSEEALMVYFALMCCSDFTRPRGTPHVFFSY